MWSNASPNCVHGEFTSEVITVIFNLNYSIPPASPSLSQSSASKRKKFLLYSLSHLIQMKYCSVHVYHIWSPWEVATLDPKFCSLQDEGGSENVEAPCFSFSSGHSVTCAVVNNDRIFVPNVYRLYNLYHRYIWMYTATSTATTSALHNIEHATTNLISVDGALFTRNKHFVHTTRLRAQ